MKAQKSRTSRLLAVVAGTVAVAGVLGVVSAAFALSFDAIRAVAVAAHIRPSLAWLFPVAVDGAMSVATVCAVVLRARGRSAAYPWLVVLFGAAVSVVANGLHAWVDGGAVALPGPWAVALSAVPPVLLALSIHLLIVLALSVSDSRSDTSSDSRSDAPATPERHVNDIQSDSDSGTGSDMSATPDATPERHVSDIRGDIRSDKPATPRPRRTRPTTRRRTTYDAVADAYRRDPGFDCDALAKRLGVTRRTVERHRETVRREAQADAMLSAVAAATAPAPSLNGHAVIDGEVISGANH